MEKTFDVESLEDSMETKIYNAKMENIQIALLNRNPEFTDMIYFHSQEYRKDLQQRKQKQDIQGYNENWNNDNRPKWLK